MAALTAQRIIPSKAKVAGVVLDPIHNIFGSRIPLNSNTFAPFIVFNSTTLNKQKSFITCHQLKNLHLFKGFIFKFKLSFHTFKKTHLSTDNSIYANCVPH